jgi:hypothetical protein
MKAFTKFLAACLALVLLALPVKADSPTYTITIDPYDTGQTYTAYQILGGDVAEENGTLYLSNVTEGANVSLTDLKSVLNLTGNETAKDAAKALAQRTSKSTELQTIANALEGKLTGAGTVNTDNTISGLQPGYYLVKSTAIATSKQGTLAILQVAGNVTVAPKTAGTPTVSIQVKDDNATLSDTADYAVEETVPFVTTVTLPSDFNTINSPNYFVKVELNHGALTDAALGDITVAAKKTDGSDLTLTAADYVTTNGTTAILDLAKLAKAADIDLSKTSLVINSTGKLAAYDDAGAKATATVSYSQDPYSSAASYVEVANTSSAAVFSYKIVVTKVDAQKAPLNGAGFTITDKANKTYTATVNDNVFTFTGLTDGVEYTLTESTVPAGYNKAADITFTISGDHAADTSAKGWTVTNASANGLGWTADSNTFTVTIENEKGVVLPSTGGLGTKLLIGGGSAVVVAAGLFLVTNKRISKEKF